MFKVLEGATAPTRATKYSAMVDLYANADVVKSNSHKPTTFKIEFIEGGFCATQSEHNYPTRH